MEEEKRLRKDGRLKEGGRHVAATGQRRKGGELPELEQLRGAGGLVGQEEGKQARVAGAVLVQQGVPERLVAGGAGTPQAALQEVVVAVESGGGQPVLLVASPWVGPEAA